MILVVWSEVLYVLVIGVLVAADMVLEWNSVDIMVDLEVTVVVGCQILEGVAGEICCC